MLHLGGHFSLDDLTSDLTEREEVVATTTQAHTHEHTHTDALMEHLHAVAVTAAPSATPVSTAISTAHLGSLLQQHESTDLVQHPVGRISMNTPVQTLRENYASLNNLVSAMLNITAPPPIPVGLSGPSANLTFQGHSSFSYHAANGVLVIEPMFLVINRGSYTNAFKGGSAYSSPAADRITNFTIQLKDSQLVFSTHTFETTTSEFRIAIPGASLQVINLNPLTYIVSYSVTVETVSVVNNLGEVRPAGVITLIGYGTTYVPYAHIYIGDTQTVSAGVANPLESNQESTSKMEKDSPAVAYVALHEFDKAIWFPRQPTGVHNWNPLAMTWINTPLPTSFYVIEDDGVIIDGLQYYKWSYTDSAPDAVPRDLKFTF